MNNYLLFRDLDDCSTKMPHGIGAARRLYRECRQKPAAVAVQHSSKVELRRGKQAFKLGVEKIGKRAAAVLGCANGFVRNFYLPVKVFERGDKLQIIVAVRRGQLAVLVASAHAAVNSESRRSAYFLAPHVGGGLFYLGKQRVYSGVE